MVHIWGRLTSLNVRKVVWAAQEVGVPFTRTDAGMAFGIVKTPEYLALNPNALVPTLQDGDLTLWESNAIVRYLCAKHASGVLYPLDLAKRFDAERWMDWQQTTLNRAGGGAFIQLIRTPEAQRDAAAIAQSVAAMAPLCWSNWTSIWRTRGYMTGDAFTMADIPDRLRHPPLVWPATRTRAAATPGTLVRQRSRHALPCAACWNFRLA